MKVVDHATQAVVQRRTRTAVLVGGHLARERCAVHASHEQLVTGTRRMETWLDAIERGEVDLTAKQVETAQKIYRKRIRVDLAEVIAEYRDFGMSDDACALVEAAPGTIDGESTDVTNQATDASGVRDAMSARDRLLLVTPLLVLVAAVWLVARVLQWSEASGAADSIRTVYRTASGTVLVTSTTVGASTVGGWLRRSTELIDSVVVPAAFLAALVALLGARRMDVVFGYVSTGLRSRKRMGYYDDIVRALNHNGLPSETAKNWELEPVSGFLIPRYRRLALEAATRCRLCERLEPMLVMGCIVSIAAAVAGLLNDVSGGGAAVQWGVAGLLGGLVVSNHVVATQAAEECSAAVMEGLGWNRHRAIPTATVVAAVMGPEASRAEGPAH